MRPDDPEARDAGYLLGRIFHEKALYDRAADTLREVAPREPSTKQDLEILSLLAESLERSSQHAAAIETLEEIVAVDESHADVAARLERLREQVALALGEGGPDQSDRYELRDEIGRGGMGVVHLAWDAELERPVAIKFLPADVATNPSAVEMFRFEARAAAAMNHSNIVRIYDVTVVAGQPCIVMEYVQGRTVREMMKIPNSHERQPLPPYRVVEIAREVCHALAFAHARGIVHRDIKPSNVLIDSDGGAKVLDFGISKMFSAGSESKNDTKGTPQYMPPEQILGSEIDGRADLYALGITMFEMVVGLRPFRGEDVVEKQIHRELPDPRLFREEVPEGLVEVIKRACRKEPDRRYASATAMATALSQALSES